MKRAWARQRAEIFAAAGAGGSATPAPPPAAESPVGRDFHRRSSRLPRRARSALWPPLLVGAVLAALFLTALRVSILRLRYELAAALTTETELLESKRTAAVELQELRNPTRLQRRAAEMGLGRPERVVDLLEEARHP